ncbi:MAG: NADH-quinone oxidoreductase subunit C [Phycisphaerales bacterium]|nr:NADH-quinone oxidoreductase subunit C [Phycisphaerales bacterium]
MNAKSQQVASALAARFPDIDFAPFAMATRKNAEQEQTCVRVPAERLVEVMEFLYADSRCRFEQLCDLTCVDYLNFPKARDRFAVTYSLLSLSLEQRIWVKCFVNDPNPEVPSVTGIWKGAEWMEREVYDLFGVRFTGHPDLRRIMTWEGFTAHPLRKDYPLRGRGERENFEVVTTESA